MEPNIKGQKSQGHHFLNDQKKGMAGHSNKETEKGKVQQFYSLNASP